MRKGRELMTMKLLELDSRRSLAASMGAGRSKVTTSSEVSERRRVEAIPSRQSRERDRWE